MLSDCGLKLRLQKCKKEIDKVEYIVRLQGRESGHTQFINEMMELKEISRFEY